MRVPTDKVSLAAASANPEPPTDSLYICRSTNFAAYLLTTSLLAYHGARLAPNNWDVHICFSDPEHKATELFKRYNNGTAELVDPHSLFQIRGFLIGEIRRIQGEVAGAGVDDAKR